MIPNCLVCATASNLLMNKDGFDEYLCPNCALSFVWPQPDPEWLKDKVYSLESGYQANKRPDLSVGKQDKRTRKIFDHLEQKKPKGIILDVGCSSGQFLYFAREKGFSGVGIEINKRTADIARSNGFEIHNGFLDTAPFPKNSFDIIYLGDVIEHVNDPQKFVETSLSFLKHDGIVVVSTPNTDCFWSRSTLWLYKKFSIPWAVVTPPHHLSQFSYNNLNFLLKNFAFVHEHAIFTNPSSLKYELGSLHLYGRWKRNRNLENFLFMLFSFTIYSLVYLLNSLMSPFFKRDFQMVIFYEKQS
jgi:2-polyprenyl-3-methyl-5-hydroxy-6-metoxy-1,4-benzoquinol methylase